MTGRFMAALKDRRHLLVNVYLFLNILGFSCRQGYAIYRTERLDFVEISFILQNLVMAAFVLIRSDHRVIDGSIRNQAVAVIAFFSGIAFMGQTPTGNPLLVHISQGIILAANILGMVTLFNLGKSFGILIAYRNVKTGGLYRFVRHPMYATDILLRIGFIVSHCNPFTVALFMLSTGCYVWRAILEERFLALQPEYLAYMRKVRYRFIPCIF
jgi:protein-S-isoprenylcysteine O-methyltransferase Ste14